MKNSRVAKFSISAIAILLILLTSASFIFVGGTLAKYEHSATVSKNARVAKWGVIISCESLDGEYLFSDSYYEQDNYNTATGTTLMASSTDSSPTVAPGTGNSFIIKVSGSPEVPAKLAFDATETTLVGDWTGFDGLQYEPIVWSIAQSSNEAPEVLILDEGTMDEFINCLAHTTIDFEPNTAINEVFTITWQWKVASEGDADYNERNKNDTTLVKKNPMPGLNFNITTSMTQIEK